MNSLSYWRRKLLDCTRDAGHVMKMAVMLRYADKEKWCIEEQFTLLVVAVEDVMASVLMDTFF